MLDVLAEASRQVMRMKEDAIRSLVPDGTPESEAVSFLRDLDCHWREISSECDELWCGGIKQGELTRRIVIQIEIKSP